jgi:uncharacterized protein YneF (UPF0154 family)
MQAVVRGFPAISLLFAMAVDRLIIPLAVVVGLAGGAMIGTELTKLNPPVLPAIH